MDTSTEDVALAYLAEESAEDAAGGDTKVAAILADFLATSRREEDKEMVARETAQRINSDYYDLYLPSDPLLKGQDDKGMASWLFRLYSHIFTLGELIPHDDPRHCHVVQVLVELRRLPPKTFKIYRSDCVVYINDPVFTIRSDDWWNTNIRRDGKGGKKFDQWVNISAFFASCVVAGVYGTWVDVFKYPDVDVDRALEKELPEGTENDCRLLVAAQWLIIAGPAIHKSMAEENVENWGPGKWAHWEVKLKEVIECRASSNADDSVLPALRSAMDVMVTVNEGRASHSDDQVIVS